MNKEEDGLPSSFYVANGFTSIIIHVMIWENEQMFAEVPDEGGVW